jgi:hypothetical protein
MEVKEGKENKKKKRKEKAIDQKIRVKKVMPPKNKVLAHVQLVSCSYLRLSMAHVLVRIEQIVVSGRVD